MDLSEATEVQERNKKEERTKVTCFYLNLFLV